jgi:uracil-DNA glycosylase family 4
LSTTFDGLTGFEGSETRLESVGNRRLEWSRQMTRDSTSARRSMTQVLRGWRQSGVDFLPLSRASTSPTFSTPTIRNDASSDVAPTSGSAAAGPTSRETDCDMPRAVSAVPQASRITEASAIWPDMSPLPIEERLELLAPVRNKVAACTRCKELAACRTQTVFGVGNIRPRLCFFGEAPGADEDKQGEPFVGRAGQLLDKIIEAMTLKREDVYILNTLKCRPPSNRTPLPDEVENCREYFTRQLEILRPEFLVCLGACAAQSLLRTKESIGKLRGVSHDYRGIKVYATYHPAYLLRNPPAKRDVWEDMKIVMKEMGLAIPAS